MKALLSSIRIWADMVKFSHSVFALPFALMAAFMAGQTLPGRGWPYLDQLGLIVLCMVAARSVAMTFNRIVDAKLDAQNPRTAQRPLPAGRITAAAAWGMLVLSILTFGTGCFGFYLLHENTWPILLAGPVLLLLCSYSFAKRFTRWSHFHLGIAIAFSPVAAWLAINPQTIGWSAVVLMATVTCWIGGFDIIYACQDIDVDKAQGLHSLPSRIGPGRALWIARLSHALAAVGLVLLGVTAELGWIYGIGVALAVTLLIVENSLVRAGDYRRVNVAFFTINGVVSVVLGASAILDVLVG